MFSIHHVANNVVKPLRIPMSCSILPGSESISTRNSVGQASAVTRVTAVERFAVRSWLHTVIWHTAALAVCRNAICPATKVTTASRVAGVVQLATRVTTVQRQRVVAIEAMLVERCERCGGSED